MARIRSIKPEFFTSLTIANLELAARLTFVGLWTHCDDEGRCVDDARLIKAAVWPLDDVTAPDVERFLRALSEASLITRYEVGGRRFLAVSGWSEHQRINRPTKSKFPSPDEADSPKDEALISADEDSRPALVLLTEDSLSPHGRKGTGNREQGKEEPPAAAGPLAPASETPNQRANRLAKVYTDRVKPSNFPAVAKIVRKAVDANCTNELITKGLLALADDGRSCTTDQLRIAMFGKPRPAAQAANGSGPDVPQDRYSYSDNPEDLR